jgi:hypothetical protein
MKSTAIANPNIALAKQSQAATIYGESKVSCADIWGMKNKGRVLY